MTKPSNPIWISFASRIPVLAYLAWLYAYVWLMTGGHYTAYLHPKLWPFLVIAVIIGLVFLVASIRRSPSQGHGWKKSETWLQSIILALPLVFLWGIHGESLGTHTLAKRSLSLKIGASSAARQTDADAARPSSNDRKVETATLIDLKIDRRQQLIGQRVSTDGIVYRGKERLRDFLLDELPGGCLILFRFRIVCCAADAVPIGVLVCGNDMENLGDDRWVRITGQYVIKEIGRDSVPCINAEEVTEIPPPPPEKRYLFRQR